MEKKLQKTVVVSRAPLELNYLESDGKSVIIYNINKMHIDEINRKKLDEKADMVFDLDEVQSSRYIEMHEDIFEKMQLCDIIMLNEVARRRFNTEPDKEAMITYTPANK